MSAVKDYGPDLGYERLDLRGLELTDMADTVQMVFELKKKYPKLNRLVISRSQREQLVKSDPVAFAGAMQLEQQFEKPMSELDFMMMIEKCFVEVE